MLRAPSQPETSNSPVCLRGKEKEKGIEGRDVVVENGVHRRTMNVAAKVPVQVVSL